MRRCRTASSAADRRRRRRFRHGADAAAAAAAPSSASQRANPKLGRARGGRGTGVAKQFGTASRRTLNGDAGDRRLLKRPPPPGGRGQGVVTRRMRPQARRALIGRRCRHRRPTANQRPRNDRPRKLRCHLSATHKKKPPPFSTTVRWTPANQMCGFHTHLIRWPKWNRYKLRKSCLQLIHDDSS